ncbi:hypothetical protein [Candidatus Ruthturnera calyptogenae]|uniref:hypothetical protein n=1 Tax=Candidatus Ruthturnera calyptogenae TaxID=386487 RepID=UPI0012FF2848|nr:hypothetical protein [Candidatus Ruthturnera calyptogenae]
MAFDISEFMPVSSYDTVKAMTPEEVMHKLFYGAPFLAIILGTDVIKEHEYLHVMYWQV